MPRKAKVTKTTNPLHFEDLEPHRFEDLVRRLLYGFREWINIEPTGRGGSDEGFDVRAWERDDAITNVSEEGEEGTRSVGGRLWQIQAKREKIITPAKMRELVKDGVDGQHPPHGYVLAAATNITKSCFDVFRDELKKKGVKEFYFWGKDHLEDQLALPQNDDILFTFFGISLSPRRRSRISEIKFTINNKNKIQRLLFGSEAIRADVPKHKSFLLRDIKDTQYPNSDRYQDFEKARRWEEHDVCHMTPTGIFFQAREWYAYVDLSKKAWDFTRSVDLTPRHHNIDSANQARLEDSGKKAERFWRHLPLKHQAKLMVYGFVAFDDILLIDDKGDAERSDPHLFVDFGSNGPFSYVIEHLVHERSVIKRADLAHFARAKAFPKTFHELAIGPVRELAGLNLPAEMTRAAKFLHGSHVWYGFDGRLDQLSDGDVIHIPAEGQSGSEKHIEVTHVSETTVAGLMNQHDNDAYYKGQLKAHAEREVKDHDQVRVCEIHAVMLFAQSSGVHYLDSSY